MEGQKKTSGTGQHSGCGEERASVSHVFTRQPPPSATNSCCNHMAPLPTPALHPLAVTLPPTSPTLPLTSPTPPPALTPAPCCNRGTNQLFQHTASIPAPCRYQSLIQPSPYHTTHPAYTHPPSPGAAPSPCHTTHLEPSNPLLTQYPLTSEEVSLCAGVRQRFRKVVEAEANAQRNPERLGRAAGRSVGSRKCEPDRVVGFLKGAGGRSMA